MTTGSVTQTNEEKTATLMSRDYKDPQCVSTWSMTTGSHMQAEEERTSPICQRDYKSMTSISSNGRTIRRLTPMECERLQGFPDTWTDIGEWTDTKGKVHKESSDAARYKALGNSIALPPWKWVLKRICAEFDYNPTMGSLFSGIGGFDLLWLQLNGPDTVKWESEIEEFPIAVTKRHFGDEETGQKGDFYEYLYGGTGTEKD